MVSTPPKIYVIAGEASGDLHGSNLVSSLLQQSPQTQLKGWGGDAMQKAGVMITKHIRELAFMGFAEVVANLPTILRNFKDCKKDILEFCPDLVVLIDYPGFNLRMAKWLKKQGITTVYYIAPQVWAWKENRVKSIRQNVDLLLSILPFEPVFFARHDIEAMYVGHPLREAVQRFKAQYISENLLNETRAVALLPGSRKQEIKVHLPLMLQLTRHFEEYDFYIAAAPAQELDFYEQIILETLGTLPRNIHILTGKTYDILLRAHMAVVCSGTATLETALFKVPQVVCYKGNKISYWIAKMLIKVKYISLVNLILDRPFLTELIQDDFSVPLLKKELERLAQSEVRKNFSVAYNELEQQLAVDEYASDKAARLILTAIRK